jgi:hypothetical protein
VEGRGEERREEERREEKRREEKRREEKRREEKSGKSTEKSQGSTVEGCKVNTVAHEGGPGRQSRR